jgi:hypothetical protein
VSLGGDEGAEGQALVLAPEALEQAGGGLEAVVGWPVAVVLTKESFGDEWGVVDGAEVVRLGNWG